MGDEKEDLNLEEGEAIDSGGGKRAGGLVGGILPLLKWVGIGLGGILFIVGVVVITVSAMNAGGAGATNVQDESLIWNPVPKVYVYTDLDSPLNYTLKDSWTVNITGLTLGYDESDKQIPTEITNRKRPMSTELMKFFNSRTHSEVQDIDRMRESLRIYLNNALFQGAIKTIDLKNLNVIEPQE